MKPETITALQQLVQAAGSRRELLLDAGQGMVRIDLKPEDVALWHDNLSSQPQGTNLLLACESQGGELSQTRLSWVVGAAIRPTQVENGEQALAVLQPILKSTDVLTAVWEGEGAIPVHLSILEFSDVDSPVRAFVRVFFALHICPLRALVALFLLFGQCEDP